MPPMDFEYSGIHVIQRNQKSILSKFYKTLKPDITACTIAFAVLGRTDQWLDILQIIIQALH